MFLCMTAQVMLHITTYCFDLVTLFLFFLSVSGVDMNDGRWPDKALGVIMKHILDNNAGINVYVMEKVSYPDVSNMQKRVHSSHKDLPDQIFSCLGTAWPKEDFYVS